MAPAHLKMLIEKCRSNHPRTERYVALNDVRNLAHRALGAIQELITIARVEKDKVMARTIDDVVDYIRGSSQMFGPILPPDVNAYESTPKHQTPPPLPPPPPKPPLAMPVDVSLARTEIGDLAAGTKVCRKCNFCEHDVHLTNNRDLLQRLSPADKFYCAFCLRNNLHTKEGRNFLLVSFRAIFGYFYYELFLLPKQTSMYLSEIQDYIDMHVTVGLRNPVFLYNMDTFCWAIDFSKIGTSKKKIPLEYVLKTVVEILASLNLTYNIRGVKVAPLFQKYKEAVEKFYESRYRPVGQKLCVPTLKNCGTIEWLQNHNPLTGSKVSIEDTKLFLPNNIKEVYAATSLDPY